MVEKQILLGFATDVPTTISQRQPIYSSLNPFESSPGFLLESMNGGDDDDERGSGRITT